MEETEVQRTIAQRIAALYREAQAGATARELAADPSRNETRDPFGKLFEPLTIADLHLGITTALVPKDDKDAKDKPARKTQKRAA